MIFSIFNIWNLFNYYDDIYKTPKEIVRESGRVIDGELGRGVVVTGICTNRYMLP